MPTIDPIVGTEKIKDSYGKINEAISSLNSATSAATPNTLVQRDGNGRFKAAAPSASDDVARKAEVDAISETGTFTPELRFGGASTGIAYSTITGRYTRIRNVVYWAVHIALTSKGTATGAATIAGLPFAAINAAPNATTAVGLAENVTLPSGADWACGIIFNNSAEVTLRASGNVVNVNLTDVNFSNNSGIRMEGFYYI